MGNDKKPRLIGVVRHESGVVDKYYDVEPETIGGLTWGTHQVWREFPKRRGYPNER